MEGFLLRSGKRQGYVCTFITSMQHCNEGSSQCNNARKINKRLPYRKGICKTILFADDIMLDLESSKESTKKNY